MDALQAGYRHLDCAWEYGVDKEVGEGIQQSGIPREEIFITSKVWPQFMRPENVEICVDKVLTAMRLEQLDLLLAHFPAAVKPSNTLDEAVNFPGATAFEQACETDSEGNYVSDLPHCPQAVAALNGGNGSFVSSWKAMQRMVRIGKVRAVGLSNFEREHVEELLPHASHDDVPISCNQIEANPWYPNTELVEFLSQNGILTTIYSPFAPKTFFVQDGIVHGKPFTPVGHQLLDDPTIKDIARRNNMDSGQVIQSWSVQRGTIPLGKSQSKARMSSNLSVRRLSEDNMKMLADMELKGRRGKSTDLNLLFPGVKIVA